MTEKEIIDGLADRGRCLVKMYRDSDDEVLNGYTAIRIDELCKTASRLGFMNYEAFSKLIHEEDK